MKTAHTPTRGGGGVAADIVNNGRGCRFSSGVTKAMSNRQGAVDDNLWDDAATGIFADNLSCGVLGQMANLKQTRKVE